ncbi:MAG TPA: peptide chain release factor N(5)-glutamine methyltransferase [Phycisphaerales bacterium]|nr:peptide chain release factor N(5)-glutamine methyltransferase [Phycisphaerales bacterium]
MPHAAGETWTTRQLLAWIVKALAERRIDSPRICAELLISHVLGCDRLHLYMHADRPASPGERERLRTLVSRALAHEPVQYLVGESWFFSLPFSVDARVLIPRPSTETIVEHVIRAAKHDPRYGEEGPLIADICTGSGCVAVSLLVNLPNARAIATDISQDALDVARANAARHEVDARIDFRQGDLLAPLISSPNSSFDVVLSNPPYIPDHEWEAPGMVGRNVKGREPEIALRGGPDGLRFITPLINDAPMLLRPGGTLMVEVATSTADAVLALARAQPLLTGAAILPDFEGLPRVLIAHRAG